MGSVHPEGWQRSIKEIRLGVKTEALTLQGVQESWPGAFQALAENKGMEERT